MARLSPTRPGVMDKGKGADTSITNARQSKWRQAIIGRMRTPIKTPRKGGPDDSELPPTTRRKMMSEHVIGQDARDWEELNALRHGTEKVLARLRSERAQAKAGGGAHFNAEKIAGKISKWKKRRDAVKLDMRKIKYRSIRKNKHLGE